MREKMTGFEIEKAMENHAMNSHIKWNGECNGSTTVCSSTYKTSTLKPPFGLHSCVKRKTVFYFAVVGAILNLSLITAILLLSVRTKEPSPALPTCPVVSCPNGWVGYQGRCYFFAEVEANWTSSKMHCSSLNATLAVVDSQEEMEFMLRYKGDADHWIGLQRNISQPWKWTNGTIFNGWFTILGGGSCAYVNQQGIASSSCSRQEQWICSKPVVR